jgi:hypothetical protein
VKPPVTAQVRTDGGELMSIGYVVRWSDFAAMYLGSWSVRLLAVPGLLLMAAPLGTSAPLVSYVLLIGGGFLLALVGVAYTAIGMARWDRAASVVGRSITLRIDDDGVWGWPLAVDLDTSWGCLRKARRFWGVNTLPFRNHRTRAGWIPIPDRALSPEERKSLLDLLKRRGVI